MTVAKDKPERPALPELTRGLWKENPIFIGVLGLCPSLAVTNSLQNAIVMGVATAFVLVGSSLFVSLLRHTIPKAIRISAFVIIIATFVTTVDFALAAWLPLAHKQLGAFIALIVVNCVILGRAEAFASKHSPRLAMADGLGMAGGFTFALMTIGAIREILGSGTLLGIPVLGDNYEPWAIMVLPPGGFLTLGCLLIAFAWVKEKRERAAVAARSQAGEKLPAERQLLDGGRV